MADDIDSHKKIIEIIHPLTLNDFMDRIINIRYLACIFGGKVTLVVKYKNKPLSVIEFMDYIPKVAKMKIKLYINNIDLMELLTDVLDNKIGFGYYAQEDYNNVCNKLKEK